MLWSAILVSEVLVHVHRKHLITLDVPAQGNWRSWTDRWVISKNPEVLPDLYKCKEHALWLLVVRLAFLFTPILFLLCNHEVSLFHDAAFERFHCSNDLGRFVISTYGIKMLSPPFHFYCTSTDIELLAVVILSSRHPANDCLWGIQSLFLRPNKKNTAWLCIAE